MVRNRSYAVIGIVLLVLAGAGPVLGQGQGGKLSELLGPFVNDQTLVVVAIDVSRVDVDAFFDTGEEMVGAIVAEEEAAEVKAEWQKAREELKEGFDDVKSAGVKIAYVLWSLDNLQNPIFAVPLGAGGSTLESWLRENVRLGNEEHVRRGDVLFVGDKRVMERRKGAAAVVRTELDAAVAAAGDATIKVLLIPSVDSRRVIEGTLPLLLEGGQVPANAITKGFQWGAISVSLPPKLSVRAYVQSADSASAKSLAELWGTISGLVGQMPESAEVRPSVNAVLGMLKPEVAASGLRLSLDEGQCERLVTDLLVPPLAEARAQALRIRCGTNLSGLGKAILIYANDHKDNLPPNLEILIEKAEVRPETLICCGKKYVHRGADVPNTSCEPSMIMVHDRAGNHEGGRNVLFLDSHVEWVTEERFQELINKDNEIRRKEGLPEKPAQ